jgi:hypothetical protein
MESKWVQIPIFTPLLPLKCLSSGSREISATPLRPWWTKGSHGRANNPKPWNRAA